MNKKILALALAGVMAVSSAITSFADGITKEVSDYQGLLDALSEKGVTKIVLTQDVQVDKMLDITTPNVTLDLGGNTLTASDSFTSSYNPAEGKLYENDSHLVNVNADGVTITNGTLKTTEDNKHVLNIFESSNVTIGDLTLDHTNAYKGAPLVINKSSVVVDDELALKTGSNSWYGINVDSKGVGASIKFESGAVTTISGEKNTVLYVEPVTAEGGGTEPDPNVTVSGAENAGLVESTDGVYGFDASVIPETGDKETSDREYGDYFGNAKWAEVKSEIAKLAEDEKTGETIEFNAAGLPWFPSSVARALKGHDITLEVRKNGTTYSINGLEIGPIAKIWYEFDQIETQLLTVKTDAE